MSSRCYVCGDLVLHGQVARRLTVTRGQVGSPMQRQAVLMAHDRCYERQLAEEAKSRGRTCDSTCTQLEAALRANGAPEDVIAEQVALVRAAWSRPMATIEQLRDRYGLELDGTMDCTSCLCGLDGHMVECPADSWIGYPRPVSDACWISCRPELARVERERMGRG